jgi:hypothetical protein
MNSYFDSMSKLDRVNLQIGMEIVGGPPLVFEWHRMSTNFSASKYLAERWWLYHSKNNPLTKLPRKMKIWSLSADDSPISNAYIFLQDFEEERIDSFVKESTDMRLESDFCHPGGDHDSRCRFSDIVTKAAHGVGSLHFVTSSSDGSASCAGSIRSRYPTQLAVRVDKEGGGHLCYDFLDHTPSTHYDGGKTVYNSCIPLASVLFLLL